MRRIIVLFAVLAVLSNCAAEPEVTAPATVEPTAAVTSSALPQLGADANPDWDPAYAEIRENFPSIDGSSPTVQLEAAIRARIFDSDHARKASHTSTAESFRRLLPDSDNSVDMVLATDYAESYFQHAAELGADIVKVPVAIEGFVFIVNAENPVQSISQDDLRRIYSGELTNWKELGRNDAPIIAYQRNLDSGSQAEMIRFMGSDALTEVDDSARISGMSAIIDVVADPESGANSIGDNVYSYTAKQHAPANGSIRMVAIDGVAPTDSTLGRGEYPLQSYFYSYYDRSNELAARRAKTLTDWIVSEDGQSVVASVGYINLNGDNYREP